MLAKYHEQALTTGASGQLAPVTVNRQGVTLVGGEVNSSWARAMLERLGVCKISPLPFRSLYMNCRSSSLRFNGDFSTQ